MLENQTISFTPPGPSSATVGGPTYTPVATATSTLPVTITLDSTSTGRSLSGTGVVSFTGIGSCVIDANQGGNGSYNPAPPAQESIAVIVGGGPSDQTIMFNSSAPTDASAGMATYTPMATATSGLPVTITVDPSSASVCVISAGGVVSFVAPGTCLLDANQGGNGSYNPAPQVQQPIVVTAETWPTDPSWDPYNLPEWFWNILLTFWT